MATTSTSTFGEGARLDQRFKAEGAPVPSGITAITRSPTDRSTHEAVKVVLSHLPRLDGGDVVVNSGIIAISHQLSPRTISTPHCQILTRLFIETLPVSVRSTLIHERVLYPLFFQNIVTPESIPLVPGRHLTSGRIRLCPHSELQTTLSALKSLASLASVCEDASSWNLLLKEVDTLLKNCFSLAYIDEHAPSGTAPCVYAAKKYIAHLGLRTQLTLLMAIALQQGELTFTTEGAKYNIGRTVVGKQGAHHSPAPSLSTNLRENLLALADKFDSKRLKEELGSTPPFESDVDHPVPEQLQISRSLLATGMPFNEFLEAATKKDAATHLKRYIEETQGSGDFLHTQTLSWVLHNTTYPAEALLNNLDGAVEKVLRESMKNDGPFFLACRDRTSMAAFVPSLVEDIKATVIKTCTPITTTEAMDFLDKALGDYVLLIRAIDLLWQDLEKVKKVTEGDAAAESAPPSYDDVKRTINRLLSCAEGVVGDMEKAGLSTPCQASYLDPSLARSIKETLQAIAKKLPKCKSSWALPECRRELIQIIELINSDNPHSIIAMAGNARTTGKSLSLCARLNNIIYDLHTTISEAVPLATEITRDGSALEAFLTEQATKIVGPYTLLSPGQKSYFQHLLRARVLPKLQNPTDPAAIAAIPLNLPGSPPSGKLAHESLVGVSKNPVIVQDTDPTVSTVAVAGLSLKDAVRPTEKADGSIPGKADDDGLDDVLGDPSS